MWYGAASVAEPRRVGHAWEAILHGSRDPCMGHRMFCATEDCEGRRAKVSTLYIVKDEKVLILVLKSFYEVVMYFNYLFVLYLFINCKELFLLLDL